jgi:hypothetical protein
MNKVCLILILFSNIFIGCKSYQTIDGDKCGILNDTTLFSFKVLLERVNIDTSYSLQKLTIDYSRSGYYLIDKKNKWELNFSGNYPDVHIKYFDNDFVILYCPVSGIMNGLTLFPSNHDDLFIINRRIGKKVLDLQSKVGGITKALIKDSVIYFEYYEPDVVRFFKMEQPI